MAVAYEYDSFASATPADTNLATLLTLGAGEELVQAQVQCCNISGADLTVRVGIGTGASQDYWLCYDFTLYANLFVRFYIPGLGSLNKVFVRTSSASDVDFSISGLKKTTT
jgi:hypothetical protein